MRIERPIFHFFVMAIMLFVAAASLTAVNEFKAEAAMETAFVEPEAAMEGPAEGVAWDDAEAALASGSVVSQKQYRYVRCNSSLGRRNTCETFGKNPVRLWRRHSASGCVKRRDWNTTNGGRFVWVTNGCQATFQVRARY